MPGYYYQAIEDNGSELVFWFGDRTVRFTSFTAEAKDGVADDVRETTGTKEKERPRGNEVLEFEQDHMRGWAAMKRHVDEKAGYLYLQGEMTCGNSLAIVTICFNEPEDKGWAVKTFKTLFHPKPDLEAKVPPGR